MTKLHQFPGIFMVDGLTLGLPVGGIRSADVRAFIIIDPQPVQSLDQLLLGIRVIALLIGIFNAQDESSTCAARQQEGIESRPGIANVHAASG